MSVAVGLGLMEFPFDGVAGYWRWVDLCEAGGVDSLWQTDRLLSREPILECMTAMAALAGRTRRIKFGMNVVSLALRDPVLVAKQCATIDVLSQGRLLPAFGIGSPRAPEWAALHVDTRTRGRKTDEGLEIVRRLWREDSVDFTGEHYRLTGATISPKPVQADLPMWIGGGSEAAIRRTARVGTGWQGGPETPPEAARIVAAIKAAAAEAGRSIDEDHYGASFPFYFGRSAQPGAAAGDGRLHQADGQRRQRLLRHRRRRRHRRADRRLRRSRRLEVRAAPRGCERRGGAGPDPPAHRAGAAAGRVALAATAKAQRSSQAVSAA